MSALNKNVQRNFKKPKEMLIPQTGGYQHHLLLVRATKQIVCHNRSVYSLNFKSLRRTTNHSS